MTTVGAGILLQPSGVDVLTELDSLDHMLQFGHRVDALYRWMPSGRAIMQVQYSDSKEKREAFGLGVHRTSLCHLLDTALTGCATPTLFWLLNRLAHTHFSKVLTPLLIGPGQQAYLLAMQEEECIHQDALAHRLAVDKSNVTRAIGVLSSQGYVHREKSSEDGRQWLIRLTPKGKKARLEVIDHAQDWVDQLKAPLTHDEWQQLSELLSRVCEHQTKSPGFRVGAEERTL